MGKLLTVNDMMKRLSLSRGVIYKLKAAGKLPKHIMVGKAIRWRPETVEEWEKELEDE